MDKVTDKPTIRPGRVLEDYFRDNKAYQFVLKEAIKNFGPQHADEILEGLKTATDEAFQHRVVDPMKDTVAIHLTVITEIPVAVLIKRYGWRKGESRVQRSTKRPH